MKSESTVRTALLELYPGLARINFNVVEEQREAEDGSRNTVYVYNMVEIRRKLPVIVPFTQDDYPMLVSSLVRERYSEDDVEAIMNNYLADPEGHKADFDELQAWRVKAKEVARDVIDATKHNS
jgi:hypothetical protein